MAHGLVAVDSNQHDQAGHEVCVDPGEVSRVHHHPQAEADQGAEAVESEQGQEGPFPHEAEDGQGGRDCGTEECNDHPHHLADDDPVDEGHHKEDQPHPHQAGDGQAHGLAHVECQQVAKEHHHLPQAGVAPGGRVIHADLRQEGHRRQKVVAADEFKDNVVISSSS